MKEYYYLVTFHVASSTTLENPDNDELFDMLGKAGLSGDVFLGELLVTRIHHHKNAGTRTISKAMKKALVIHGDHLKELSADC